MQFARVSFKAVSALAALSWTLFAGPIVEARAKRHDHTVAELGNSSEQDAEIVRARQEVLNMLQAKNGCSTWLRESDPDVAETFRSLHFKVVNEEITYILQSGDGRGGFLFKHPWAARTHELAGRDALVEFNGYGPFFHSSMPVMEVASARSTGGYRGFRQLTIGSFRGNSLPAQMTALLHELAHVIGRVPKDSDSWDGQSQKNTEEVLRNCKSEIRVAARAAEHTETNQ
jgi:hypothetical protein